MRFGTIPWRILGRPNTQTIMLALANKPLTFKELLNKVDIEREILKQELQDLLRSRLIQLDHEAYEMTILILTDKQASRLKHSLEGLTTKVSDYLSKRMDEIKHVYSVTDVSKIYRWEDTAHFIVDIYTLELSMLYYLKYILSAVGFYKQWTKNQRYLPFFGIETGTNQAVLGVNNYKIDGYGLSVMHSTLFSRDMEMEDLSELISKPEIKQNLAKLCDISSFEEDFPTTLLKMGWISRGRDGWRLRLPVIREADKERLTRISVDVAHGAAEIIAQNLHIITKAFEELGYADWMEGIGDFAMIVFNFLVVLVVEKLAHENFLPPLPRHAPMTWGVWIIKQPGFMDYKTHAQCSIRESERMVAKLGDEERKRAQEILNAAKKLYDNGNFRGAWIETRNLLLYL